MATITIIGINSSDERQFALSTRPLEERFRAFVQNIRRGQEAAFNVLLSPEGGQLVLNFSHRSFSALLLPCPHREEAAISGSDTVVIPPDDAPDADFLASTAQDQIVLKQQINTLLWSATGGLLIDINTCIEQKDPRGLKAVNARVYELQSRLIGIIQKTIYGREVSYTKTEETPWVTDRNHPSRTIKTISSSGMAWSRAFPLVPIAITVATLWKVYCNLTALNLPQ